MELDFSDLTFLAFKEYFIYIFAEGLFYDFYILADEAVKMTRAHSGAEFWEKLILE